MALPDYRVVVNTFETRPWPIHTQIFHGTTLEEAVSHYRRHFRKTPKLKNKVFFQRRAAKKEWLTLKTLE
jgi:hypothetical protein